MTTLTVTATQGGSTANGMILRIFVITGAKAVANQTGGALNLGFASNTNAWTGSITTTSGSNVYGGASMSGSGNSPTGTSVTIVDTTSDTTNAETYVTFKALNVTTGATTRGIQASPAAAGTLGAFEVLAATTLAEDASAPALASTTSAITVTSASFTPPDGSLIVAIPVSDGGASATTMTVTDNLGVHLNWTQKTSNPAAGNDYAGVWMADVPVSGGVTWVPQRYGQPAPVSPVPWAQRDRRDANTVGSAANPLVSPLDTAWQADAAYWHLYNDSALRDRRSYFQQRPLVSDPTLLQPAGNADPLSLNPEQSNSSDLWRVAVVPAFYDRREVPQQRVYFDPSLLAAAQLENELLGGAQTLRHYLTSVYIDRREVPQQRTYPDRQPDTGADVGAGVCCQWTGPEDLSSYIAQRRLISDPSFYPPQNNLDTLLIGQDYLDAHQHQAATHYDRREVPQQRLYISDPSFYPSVPPTDPLTLAWGADGPYWHLYNRAADITDRREVPQQRAYISDPLLLTTAELENELLGGADDRARHRTWYTDRHEYPAQRTVFTLPDIPADPLILGDDRSRHVLIAGYWPRGWSWFQRQFFPLPQPPPAFQVARSSPTVTDPVTSAPSVADPRDGRNTVAGLVTSSPSVS